MCQSPTGEEAAAGRARAESFPRAGREAPAQSGSADPSDPETNTTPRGNQDADERELDVGMDKLSGVLGQ